MAPVPPNSLILLTGANGFIASHIADQLLRLGHRVRGTVRTEAKGAWLQDLLDRKYGPNLFSFVVIPDLTAPGAFESVVKGVDGVAHVASDVSFDSDPNKVIPYVVKSTRAILEAVAAEPSVKRFVLTSSSSAALNPQPNKEITVTENTWNDDAVRAAWAPPPYDDPARAWNVYAASKTEGERELWKFMEENKGKIGFEASTVLPNSNWGPLLNVAEHKNASTSRWCTELWGKEEFPEQLLQYPPQYYINVVDDALLHIAALTDPDVVNERIFGFVAPFTFNQLLGILRRVAPHQTFPKDIDDDRKDLSIILPAKRAEEILKKIKGEGWTSLEESIRQNVMDL